MKKFLVILASVITASCVYAGGDYIYSPDYIQHLKNCSPYTDEYTADVKTDDEKSPYLKIKSTEEIKGWVNGKCITKNTVYSVDLERKIMVIKCSLSKSQIESLREKMKAVNSQGTTESKQIFSDEMVRIIEDDSTCKVKSYTDD